MPKPRNTRKFHAFVARGKNKGELLFPHVHVNGQYVVSHTRFERDYIFVAKADDLETRLLDGYKLRMSNLAGGIAAPILVAPKSIYRAVVR